MMWFDGMNGWWMLLGGLWMLLFWGGIIALIVWVVIRLTGHRGGTSRSHPMDVAKERYAKGEITREEFEQLKKDLA